MSYPISRSDVILGGTLVFAGTRVPVKTLIDYIGDGAPLDDFLADFPTVSKQQVSDLLTLMTDLLTRHAIAP